MARHIGDDLPEPQLGSRGVGWLGRLGLVAATVVVVLGAGVLLAPDDVTSRIPWAAAPPCDRETVSMVVEPELAPTVDEVLAPLRGQKLPEGTCLDITLQTQEGAETAAGSAVLPADRAPQLWIPDSPVWVEKATSWQTRTAANFASSPVVVTTARAAAYSLGWMSKRPTWNEALRGQRPAAVPNVQTEADSLSALIALWQTLGKGADADNAVTNLVLAADKGEVPTAEQALAIASSGSVNSPVVPATEQQVAAANEAAMTPAMAAVYPAEGSPVLTYPVTRVTQPGESPGRAAAVALVVDRLRSPQAQAAARQDGFRGPDGSPAAGEGIYEGAVQELTPPSKDEVDGMVRRIDLLSQPGRILVLLDVSLSMRERLSDGLRKLDLGAGAARLGTYVLPNRSEVGAWTFAMDYPDGKNYQEVAPMKELGSQTDRGELYRNYLIRLVQNPDRYLRDTGTAMYDVIREASRKMHEEYDPKADNAIIVLTDGESEDPDVTLPQLLDELRRANAGDKNVAIFAGALGPDAPFGALQQIAEVTGGHAYRISTAGEGETALIDGFRRSRRLGQ